METRNYTMELRALDAEAKRASGYAAVFNSDSLDLGGFVERILPGAFAQTLAEAQRGERNIFALWDHSSAYPLGSTKSGKLSLREDDHGLAFELDTSRFNEMQRAALEDEEMRMSFGFRVRDEEWREDDNGGILRTLKEVELSEVSLVIQPAYPATEAALRSLEHWKAEQRAADKVDTLEQLKRVMFLQASIRGAR